MDRKITTQALITLSKNHNSISHDFRPARVKVRGSVKFYN